MQEEKEILKQRIISMLSSKDVEMRKLGITLAFEQGDSWCLMNLPPFGHIGLKDMEEYPNSIKVGSPPDDSTIYIKSGGNNVGIMISAGYLQCRLKTQLKMETKDARRKNRYKIVEI